MHRKANNAMCGELTVKVRELFQASISLKQEVMETQCEVIARAAEAIHESVRQGGKVLFCGNGGSAADAQHLAAELLVRLRPHVNREGIAALALAADTSSLTACGNDLGFEVFYERMTRALGKPRDVLIGISTSGKSANIVRALRAAREIGMTTIGWLGGDGGLAAPECDIALIIPSATTGRVQEAHITAGHAVLELVEDLLINSRGLTVHYDMASSADNVQPS